MQIRQTIQRVFLSLAMLMVFIGVGNLLVMQLVVNRGADSVRQIGAIERLSADLRMQLSLLLLDVRQGHEDPERLTPAVESLVHATRALIEVTETPRTESFLRRILDFQKEFPGLSFQEREEWIEDLVFQSEVLLRTWRQEVEGVVVRTRREQFMYQVGTGVLVLAGMMLCLGSGIRFAAHFSDRLRQVNDLATSLASGNLTRTLEWKAEEEFLALSESLNRLVHNLSLADAEISKEVKERMFAEKKALEAARAKSAFLAHMSHEFRTPLNGILGYTQVLLMDQGLSDKNKQVVNSLKRSGESLLELINDVLDLSKIEARNMKVQKTRFYLMDILDSLKESYADQVQHKGLAFEVQLGENLPEDILSDAIRLRQILVNLIGNAFKFTDTGRITLRVETVKAGIQFEVIDTGIGIASNDLEKILQPFVQVGASGSRQNKGTGLGLSISNSLLEMMESRLKVESEVGKGTRFTFVLPQPEREGRRLVLPSRNVTGYHGERRRLILLDPAREIASTLVPLLKRVGFEVFEPTRADQALEDGMRIRPDLVLLEQKLPDMDGLVALERMRDQYFREDRVPPPFVVISDHDRPADRNACLVAGAAEVLSKPLRFMDVLELLQKQLHLEWIYGDNRLDLAAPVADEENMILPPEPVLRQLLTYSRAGDVKKLRDTVEYMRGQEAQLDAFCRVVMGLCSNYQMNALVELLQKHVKPKSILSHE